MLCQHSDTCYVNMSCQSHHSDTSAISWNHYYVSVTFASCASDQSTKNIRPFKMASLLPTKTCEFIRYPGSLTTPGCQESVVWTLLQYPIRISEAQVTVTILPLRLLQRVSGHLHSDSWSVIQYVGCDKCHESNFYLSNALFSSIPTSI